MHLNSERIGDVSDERLKRREKWTQEINRIPDTALAKVQYLQSQIGCPNVCAMCSQGASSAIHRVTEESLIDLYAALKGSITSRGSINLGNSKERHKPGVIFPYLDTDIASDINLRNHCRILQEDFGCRVRLSTVGYSAKNKRLQEIHEYLASDEIGNIDGLRLSITEYTKGFGTEQYLHDVVNFLKTYRPLLEKIGPGKNEFCIELRFKPFVTPQCHLSVKSSESESHIYAHPHKVKIEGNLNTLESTNITAIKDGNVHYSNKGLPATLIIGNTEIRNGNIFKFENQDGTYYAFEPRFSEEKTFYAIHFYPKTEKREVAGYNDAQRPFLNSLLSFKQLKGRNTWSWSDFTDFISYMEHQIKQYNSYYPEYSEHLKSHILPIVKFIGLALQRAGYNPSLFFERNFVFDTGQIVNQGRAINQFKKIINNEDDPSTPHELRGYGQGISLSAERDEVWRISPYLPLQGRRNIGFKNESFSKLSVSQPSWVFAPLNWRNLYPNIAKAYVLEGACLDRIDRETAEKEFLLPGI